eukprot:jgi/Bigna1/139369/aug1.50_g14077
MKKDKIRAMFHHFDNDRSGTLNEEEIEAFLMQTHASSRIQSQEIIPTKATPETENNSSREDSDNDAGRKEEEDIKKMKGRGITCQIFRSWYSNDDANRDEEEVVEEEEEKAEEEYQTAAPARRYRQSHLSRQWRTLGDKLNREYPFGVKLLSRNEILHRIVDFFDVDCNGVLSEEEMNHLIIQTAPEQAKAKKIKHYG